MRVDKTKRFNVSEPVVMVTVQSPYSNLLQQMFKSGSGGSLRVLGINESTVKGMDLSDRLVRMKVISKSGAMASAELTFWNEDQALLGSPVMHHGALVRLRWGYSGRLGPQREFKVEKVKGTRARVANFGLLTIVVKGKLNDLNGKPKSRVFKNMEVVDVAERIAKENGFSGFALDIASREGIRKTFRQQNQTDAQFLQQLAQQEAFAFMIVGGRFIFQYDHLVNKSLPLGYYTYYTDREGWIKRFEPETDVTVNFGVVEVKSRDPGTGKLVKSSATVRTRTRPTLGKFNIGLPAIDRQDQILEYIKGLGSIGADVVLNLGSQVADLAAPGSSTARLLRRLKRRIHRTTNTQKPGVTPTKQVINRPGATARDVRREAKTRQLHVQRRGIKARTIFIGDPDLWANFLIHVDNLAPGWSGLWKIVECVHTIDSKGFEVEMKVRKDGLDNLGKGIRPRQEQKAKSQIAARRTAPTTARSDRGVDPGTYGAKTRRRYQTVRGVDLGQFPGGFSW